MVDIGKETDLLAPLLSTAQELTWVNVGIHSVMSDQSQKVLQTDKPQPNATDAECNQQ